MNDPVFVNLIEPHPIAFSGNDDLSIWEYADLVVIRLGSSTDIGAETIGIRKELLGPVWRTLRAIDERNG